MVERRPVTSEVTGSSPVLTAEKDNMKENSAESIRKLLIKAFEQVRKTRMTADELQDIHYFCHQIQSELLDKVPKK